MIQCLTSLSFPFGIYIVVIETWHQPGCLAYANEMEREKQREYNKRIIMKVWTYEYDNAILNILFRKIILYNS